MVVVLRAAKPIRTRVGLAAPSAAKARAPVQWDAMKQARKRIAIRIDGFIADQTSLSRLSIWAADQLRRNLSKVV